MMFWKCTTLLRAVGALALAGAVASAQAPATQPATQPLVLAPGDSVVATVRGRPILASELNKALVDAYGVKLLLPLAELNLAQQYADAAHVSVTAADVEQERQRTIHGLFPEAQDATEEQLDRLLDKQGITPTEFAIAMRINALLRKIVEPSVKAAITEEKIKEAFGVLYGENIKVRDIAVASLPQAVEVKRRLAAGEDFEKVAKDMNMDAAARDRGGLMEPFSRNDQHLSEAFKIEAFRLEPGQVSEYVQCEGAYHVMKVVERIAPKLAKLADVHDSVRQTLFDSLLQRTIVDARKQLGTQSVQWMQVSDSQLKAQLDALVKEHAPPTEGADAAHRDLTRKLRSATAPTGPEKPPGTMP